MNSAAMGSSVIRQLRIVGIIEGISFLVLLGIAMPLKYLAGMPRAVSVVGMAHGVLFILYLAALAHAHVTVRWPLRRALTVLAAAVLPLGPFVIEGSLRREQRRLESAVAAPAASLAP
jgi:integral membrane protein